MQEFIHPSLWVSLTSGRTGRQLQSPIRPVCLHTRPLLKLFYAAKQHPKHLVALWLDLNSLTCFGLLDTAHPIGLERVPSMPNHRGAPQPMGGGRWSV